MFFGSEHAAGFLSDSSKQPAPLRSSVTWRAGLHKGRRLPCQTKSSRPGRKMESVDRLGFQEVRVRDCLLPGTPVSGSDPKF